ncbi:MAG: hypothetical protein WCJ82_01015 [Actinomycetota bacterium]
MRRVVAIVLAGLLMSACGSVSLDTAIRNWKIQSNFESNSLTLRHDVSHAVTVLAPADAGSLRHTVCAVLLMDADAANSSLPTPDSQASELLARAYHDFADAANVCYSASTPAQISHARALLTAGVGTLVEGQWRLRALTTH